MLLDLFFHPFFLSKYQDLLLIFKVVFYKTNTNIYAADLLSKKKQIFAPPPLSPKVGCSSLKCGQTEQQIKKNLALPAKRVFET